jgi:hypothetical protein
MQHAVFCRRPCLFDCYIFVGWLAVEHFSPVKIFEAGVSPLTRSPPVQNPTVPFGRAPGTAITGRHQNLRNRRRRGRSVEVAGRGIGRTDPLLDHPYHFDDPRRITHPGAHLVTRRHNRRRLRRPIVDSHVPTSTRRGGVRPGLRQPDRPQPPIHAGRLHNIHHGLTAGDIEHGSHERAAIPCP